MPTTLLGMVDAAIGGKTGVNLPEGKNLVGAFWQPDAVLCDLDALATLPERERRSGLGEMAKYNFLTGQDHAALPLDERVAACVRIKRGRRRGRARAGRQPAGRAVLNYGHTLARAGDRRALRPAPRQAVAVGLVYAAELARRLGRIDGARRPPPPVVEGYWLPTAHTPGVDPAELLTLMSGTRRPSTG